MIQGKKKLTLTSECILSKITSYDIMRWYMPNKDWVLNRATLSPFRQEEHESFLIGNRHGEVTFIDFGDATKRGDCFTFVKLLYNLPTLDDTLRKIDNDFGLGILSNTGDVGKYRAIVANYKQPEEMGKRYSIIQCVTRKFTNEELRYWNDYYQSLDDLRANHIYSIKELYVNKQKYPLKDGDLRFGYLYEGGYWKIYRPFEDKKRKWICNVPITTTYGLESLNSDKNALICKSLKDMLVCKKVYEHTCHVQNESLAAFSDHTINYIKEHSKEAFYGGDSDKPGKEASYAITRAFDFKHINPPDELLKSCCKDFADWAKSKGLEDVRKHFIKKRLIE